jgi:hypothetical protein
MSAVHREMCIAKIGEALRLLELHIRCANYAIHNHPSEPHYLWASRRLESSAFRGRVLRSIDRFIHSFNFAPVPAGFSGTSPCAGFLVYKHIWKTPLMKLAPAVPRHRPNAASNMTARCCLGTLSCYHLQKAPAEAKAGCSRLALERPKITIRHRHKENIEVLLNLGHDGDMMAFNYWSNKLISEGLRSRGVLCSSA